MINRLGIIGGGQLALMLIQSASKYGIDVICLDPNENSPARKYASTFINADFNDDEALTELVSLSDQVIYEFENINIASLLKLDQAKLYQGTELLALSQNRIREKSCAQSIGFKTANFAKVNTKADLLLAIDQIGYPGILKTCELGYDGKGQLSINSEHDITKASELMDNELIYEQKIDFDYEISMIAIRNKADEFVSFAPFTNKHVNGILHETKMLKISQALIEEAKEQTAKMMRQCNYFGILCIEFFVKDDVLYFNEMAPRPHNSGHVTMDSYDYSQFDLMVKALCSQKISDPRINQQMRMYNILGQHYEKAITFCQENSFAKLYIYGKDKCVKNRKMGHINIIDNEELTNKLTREVFNYE